MATPAQKAQAVATVALWKEVEEALLSKIGAHLKTGEFKFPDGGTEFLQSVKQALAAVSEGKEGTKLAEKFQDALVLLDGATIRDNAHRLAVSGVLDTLKLDCERVWKAFQMIYP